MIVKLATLARCGSLLRAILSIGFATHLTAAFGQAAFTRVTSTPLSTEPGPYRHVAWGDFDGDGDLDFFSQSPNGAAPLLFENKGSSVFLKRTDLAVTTDLVVGLGSSWADFNNDGKLDLFSSRDGLAANVYWKNLGAGQFQKQTLDSTGKTGYSYGGAWADYNRDGFLDLMTVNGRSKQCTLYRNNAGAGFTVVLGAFPQETDTSSGAYSVVWGDFNNDGWPDFVRPGAVLGMYRNNGNETFEHIQNYGLAAASQGAVWGDFDNDGDLDLFATGTDGDPLNPHPYLLRNNSGSSFSQILNSIEPSTVDCATGDLDNDGDLDLIVSNAGGGVAVYLNDGAGQFSLSTELTAMLMQGTPAGGLRGVTCVDYDKDGRLDVLVTGDPNVGYLNRNTGAVGSWLEVSLKGRGGNFSGIGARVKVTALVGGRMQTQMREIASGTGFCNDNGPVAHFGLGEAATITRAWVEWPNGQTNDIAAVPNQFVTAQQSDLRLKTNSLVLATGGRGAFEILGTTGEYRFQWWFNGAALPGETNTTLGFPDPNGAQTGTYLVRATNQNEIVELTAQLEVLTTLRDQLVGEWLMDGNGFDTSGRGHDGAVQSGVGKTKDRYGRQAMAYSFDPLAGGRIQVPDHADFAFGSSAFTISAWCIQPPFLVGGSGPGDIIGQADAAVGWHFTQKPSYQWTGAGGDGFLLQAADAPSNQWYHVVFTRSGLTWATYINGVKVDGSNYFGSVPDPSAPLIIGGLGEFVGDLDDVRIYRRALSSKEVQAMYVGESSDWLKLTQHPVGGSTTNGGNFSMTVAAQGVGPLRYQWLKNNQPVAGATNATLNLNPARTGDSGVYVARVSGAAAEFVSAPASVSVYWKTNLVLGSAGALTSSGGSTGGIGVGDYDNDGWNDVFLANHGDAPNVLLHNDHGVFSVKSGLPTRSIGPGDSFGGSAFGDYDNDGLLDLFVTTLQVSSAPAPSSLYHNKGNGVFEQVFEASGLTSSNVRFDYAAWGDLNNDGWLDIVVAGSSGNIGVFQNNGGVFQDRSSLAAMPFSGAISVSLADFDNDGDLDVLAGGSSDVRLFRNLGGFRFELVPNSGLVMDSNVATTRWADYNNDGFFDVALSSYNGLRRLYRNNQNSTFTLVAEGGFIGLEHSDLNFDGVLDAYNGHVTVDINNDGLPDLIEAGYSGQNEKVWINQGNGGKWLTVRLKGVASNRFAIGAKVRARANVGGVDTWQLRQISGGNGYSGAGPLEVYFGFGDATNIQTLRIEWPSGLVSEYSDVEPNQIFTASELPDGYPTVRVDGLYAADNVHWMTNGDAVQVTISSSYPIIYFSTNGLDDLQAYTGAFPVVPPATIYAASSDGMGGEALAEPVQITVIPSYSLTNATFGGGTISLNPAANNYLSNTVVTATNQPQAGWTFMRWELDGTNVSTQSSYQFTMDKAKTIRAVFGTSAAASGGTPGKFPVKSLYEYGSELTIWTVPANGRYFTNWSVAGVTLSTQNPYTFQVTNANQTLVAGFGFLNSTTCSLSLVPDGFGTFTRSPAGSYAYPTNSNVEIAAIPGPGSQFLYWNNDPTDVSPLKSVFMNGSKVMTAHFGQAPRVRITRPAPGEILNRDVPVLIEAEASVDDSTIQSYQFFVDDVAIAPAGPQPSVTWPAGRPLGNLGLTVTAISAKGVVANSEAVPVMVGTTPFFLTAPTPQTVAEFQPLILKATVGGGIPYYVEWYRGQPGSNIYSTTYNANLDLARVTREEAGIYRLYVSNAFGAVTSSPITLTVVLPGSPLVGTNFAANTRNASSGITVAYDGTVYIPTKTNLWARRPDGTTKWSVPGNMTLSPAVAPNGTVYIGTADGVVAVDPEDGHQKWSYPSGANWPGLAIAADGTIYFGAGPNIDALRPEDGSRKWRFPLSTYASETPSVGLNGIIYAIDAFDNLYAINPDGTQNFKKSLSYSDGQPVPLADGGVLVGATQELRVFDLNTGERRWSSVARAAYTPALGTDGVIYCGSGSKVYAVNPNGSVKWDRTVDGNVGASAAVGANGYVYFIVVNSTGNQLRIFDTVGGSVATNSLPSWTSFDAPVLTTDSRLYISSAEGVIPYVAHSAAADSDWPMYRKTPTAHGNAGGLVGDLKWKLMSMADIISSPMADPSGKVWITYDNWVRAISNGIDVQKTVGGSGISPVWSADGKVFQVDVADWTLPYKTRLAVFDTQLNTNIFETNLVGFPFRQTGVAVNSSGKAFLGLANYNTKTTEIFTWSAAEGVRSLTTVPSDWEGAVTLVEDGLLVSGGKRLHKVSFAGALMKTYDMGYPAHSDEYIMGGPAIGPQGQIYIGGGISTVLALNANLEKLWLRSGIGRIDSSPVVGPDGTLYVQTYNGDIGEYGLEAFDPANGDTKWRVPIYNDYNLASPVVTQDKTIYALGGDTLFAIRDLGNRGEIAWRFQNESLFHYSAALVDTSGTVYCAGDGGTLYALKGSSQAASTWSMYRGNAQRTGSAIPLNLPPSITVTNPLNNAAVYASTSITIKVATSDPDGTVARVDYLTNGVVMGSSSSAPFDFSVSLPPGSYSLQARAIDNGNAEKTSDAVNISVLPPAKPVVQLLAPAASDPFQAPTNITMVAQATDADGTIARVEFYALDVGLLGTVNGPKASSLYSFVWTNPPAGTHTLLARAYDNAQTFSDANVNVTVAPAAETSFRIGSSFSFAENSGLITLTVFKDGGGAGTVNFTTSPLTALVDRDFRTAQGSLSFGPTESSKTLQIQLLNNYVVEPSRTFEVRLVSSSAGTSISAPIAQVTITDDDANLANSSLIDFRLSANRPASGGLRIGLVPLDANGAWRFPWEFAWRASDTVATNVDAGDYPLEFRPSVNYPTLSSKTNSVTAGTTNSFTYQYPSGSPGEAGSLQVVIGNASEVSLNGTPQWRLAGENFRASGEVISGLAPGIYVVEFSDVTPFWITPSARQVLIQAGASTTVPVNYSRAVPPPPGVAIPVALTYSQVRNGQIRPTDRRPYPMVGQLRSSAGFGSGIAVRDRVVLTAAHVLFDETTTNFVDPGSIMWFQERMAGEYEPRPLYAAGFYVNTNYLYQRTLERQGGAQPGVAGKASQQWDAAAIYFYEPVARNGQSGYLMSDATTNEWFISFRLRELVGYPLFDLNRGKMHRTLEDFYSFSYEPGTSNLFVSPQFLSYPGNSGGPLLVSYSSDQGFFPAGIYLGSRSINGTTNSIVRAIDSMVASLINRAQSSAELAGQNFADSGPIKPVPGGSLLTPSALIVVLEPAGARAAGAKWHVIGSTGGFKSSGESFVSPTADIDIEFADAPGYLKPPVRHFSIVGGGLTNTLTINYSRAVLANPVLTAERKLRFSLNLNDGSRFVIESAPAIASPAQNTIWTPVVTNLVPFTFESPVIAPGDRNFYRARLQNN